MLLITEGLRLPMHEANINPSMKLAIIGTVELFDYLWSRPSSRLLEDFSTFP